MNVAWKRISDMTDIETFSTIQRNRNTLHIVHKVSTMMK